MVGIINLLITFDCLLLKTRKDCVQASYHFCFYQSNKIYNYICYTFYIYYLQSVDFVGERLDYPGKNPRSTGENNHGHSTHMKCQPDLA